jgi:hypothetical protein
MMEKREEELREEKNKVGSKPTERGRKKKNINPAGNDVGKEETVA